MREPSILFRATLPARILLTETPEAHHKAYKYDLFIYIQHIVVGTAIRLRAGRSGVRIPPEGTGVFSFRNRPHRLCGPSSLPIKWHRSYFLGIKWPGT